MQESIGPEFDPTELLAARGILDLNDNQIARLSGKDIRTVDKALRGQGDLVLSNLKAIAAACKCRIDIKIVRLPECVPANGVPADPGT